jgi:hypothetical protein
LSARETVALDTCARRATSATVATVDLRAARGALELGRTVAPTAGLAVWRAELVGRGDFISEDCRNLKAFARYPHRQGLKIVRRSIKTAIPPIDKSFASLRSLNVSDYIDRCAFSLRLAPWRNTHEPVSRCSSQSGAPPLS